MGCSQITKRWKVFKDGTSQKDQLHRHDDAVIEYNGQIPALNEVFERWRIYELRYEWFFLPGGESFIEFHLRSMPSWISYSRLCRVMIFWKIAKPEGAIGHLRASFSLETSHYNNESFSEWLFKRLFHKRIEKVNNLPSGVSLVFVISSFRIEMSLRKARELYTKR